MSSLTDSQYEQLRTALERRREELLAELVQAQRDHLERASSSGHQTVDDFMEQAELSASQIVRDAEARRDHDELIAVRAALTRMDEGSYGDCLECGEVIDAQRLLAQPSVARCLHCQARLEKRPAA